MGCPFPGMDPYIERREIFPDFHDRFITFVSSALLPLIRPRYLPILRDRLKIVESKRPLYPDISIVKGREVRPPRRRTSGSAAVTLDRPVVFELVRDEIREPYIEIIEPAAGNRVVTAIEVLSPDNKEPGDGRDLYLQKREEFWHGGANLVEIDLLRTGTPTVRLEAENLDDVGPWHYLIVVTRGKPPREEVYPIPLERRLPRIGVPLAHGDPDAPLDFQAVFTRTWSESPYPELLSYDGPPPGKLKADEMKWCLKQLRAAGVRNGRR